MNRRTVFVLMPIKVELVSGEDEDERVGNVYNPTHAEVHEEVTRGFAFRWFADARGVLIAAQNLFALMRSTITLNKP